MSHIHLNVPQCWAVETLECNHATTFIRSAPLHNYRQIALAVPVTPSSFPHSSTPVHELSRTHVHRRAETRRNEIAFRADPDGDTAKWSATVFSGILYSLLSLSLCLSLSLSLFLCSSLVQSLSFFPLAFCGMHSIGYAEGS